MTPKRTYKKNSTINSAEIKLDAEAKKLVLVTYGKAAGWFDGMRKPIYHTFNLGNDYRIADIDGKSPVISTTDYVAHTKTLQFELYETNLEPIAVVDGLKMLTRTATNGAVHTTSTYSPQISNYTANTAIYKAADKRVYVLSNWVKLLH